MTQTPSNHFTTWISDGPEDQPPEHDRLNPKTIAPSNAITYDSPNDVPKSLRDIIKNAHAKGLSIEQLSRVFGLPTEWIALFTATTTSDHEERDRSGEGEN